MGSSDSLETAEDPTKDRPVPVPNNQEGIVTDSEVQWYDPATHPAPKGVKLRVMTEGGLECDAFWRDDSGFLAWHPLLKAPRWLKAKIRECYLKKRK